MQGETKIDGDRDRTAERLKFTAGHGWLFLDESSQWCIFTWCNLYTANWKRGNQTQDFHMFTDIVQFDNIIFSSWLQSLLNRINWFTEWECVKENMHRQTGHGEITDRRCITIKNGTISFQLYFPFSFLCCIGGRVTVFFFPSVFPLLIYRHNKSILYSLTLLPWLSDVQNPINIFVCLTALWATQSRSGRVLHIHSRPTHLSPSSLATASNP